MKKIYKVTLTSEERQALIEFVSTGKQVEMTSENITRFPQLPKYQIFRQ